MSELATARGFLLVRGEVEEEVIGSLITRQTEKKDLRFKLFKMDERDGLTTMTVGHLLHMYRLILLNNVSPFRCPFLLADAKPLVLVLVDLCS